MKKCNYNIDKKKFFEQKNNIYENKFFCKIMKINF